LPILGWVLLLLEFYAGTCEYKQLCQIFGIVPSTMSYYINIGEEILSEALADLPEAAVNWPTLEEQAHWARLVEAKHPLVKGRWGFIDGKNFPVQV
jgi:hypothetical protein